MADGICKAKLEGDQWIIQTDLDGCGTEFNVDTASEIIDFKVYFMLFEDIATYRVGNAKCKIFYKPIGKINCFSTRILHLSLPKR